ncbi:hypothetical protein WDW86_16840 [Bdellovibrionota bacterium FG-2]
MAKSSPPIAYKKTTKSPFEDFVRDQKILVVSPNNLLRSALTSVFMSMGVRLSQLVVVSNVLVARDEIRKRNPRMIITDYRLGTVYGTELWIDEKGKTFIPAETLTIIVTEDSSEATIGRIFDKHVDLCMLYPFTPERMRKGILDAIDQKAKARSFIKTQAPEDLIHDERLIKAIRKLEVARAQEVRARIEREAQLAKQEEARKAAIPTVSQIVEAVKNEEDFTKGLPSKAVQIPAVASIPEGPARAGFIAEVFDMLVRQKRYDEAYEMARKILPHFFKKPERAEELFKLAVLTRHYDHVVEYFEVLPAMDSKTPQLLYTVSGALIVGGKDQLKKKNLNSAIVFFSKSIMASPREPRILREAIIALVEAGFLDQGRRFLDRFPPDVRTDDDFATMEFYLLDKTDSDDTVLSRGWQLLRDRVFDPIVFQIMIRRQVARGKIDSAEHLAYDAAQRWPHLSRTFLGYIGVQADSKDNPRIGEILRPFI